jgi:hypothetical protein
MESQDVSLPFADDDPLEDEIGPAGLTQSPLGYIRDVELRLLLGPPAHADSEGIAVLR